MSIDSAVIAVAALMGFPIFVLTSLAKQEHWPTSIKQLLAFVLSIIGGVAAIALTGHADSLHTPAAWVTVIGEVFTASSGIYLVLKNTDFENALASFTLRSPSPSPTPPSPPPSPPTDAVPTPALPGPQRPPTIVMSGTGSVFDGSNTTTTPGATTLGTTVPQQAPFIPLTPPPPPTP